MKGVSNQTIFIVAMAVLAVILLLFLTGAGQGIFESVTESKNATLSSTDEAQIRNTCESEHVIAEQTGREFDCTVEYDGKERQCGEFGYEPCQ